MTSSNGNIFCVTGLLCGEFTGDRWIPRTKASDATVMRFEPERACLIRAWWWVKYEDKSLWYRFIINEIRDLQISAWDLRYMIIMYWIIRGVILMADYRLAPSQWETSLQSNTVSHWLGANLETALILLTGYLQMYSKLLLKYNIFAWKMCPSWAPCFFFYQVSITVLTVRFDICTYHIIN